MRARDYYPDQRTCDVMDRRDLDDEYAALERDARDLAASVYPPCGEPAPVDPERPAVPGDQWPDHAAGEIPF